MKRAGMKLAAAAICLAIAGNVAAQQDGEVVTKQFDDGGVYEGTFRDGLRHGTGTYRLPNGYEYTGDWVEGEIRGEGVAQFPNGSVYEGQFASGKPEGVGHITFSDGGTYEGTWKDGKITGQGVAIYANGVRYEGSFRNALHHGRGVMTWSSGEKYDGEWEDGYAHGRGVMGHAGPFGGDAPELTRQARQGVEGGRVIPPRHATEALPRQCIEAAQPVDQPQPEGLLARPDQAREETGVVVEPIAAPRLDVIDELTVRGIQHRLPERALRSRLGDR